MLIKWTHSLFVVICNGSIQRFLPRFQLFILRVFIIPHGRHQPVRRFFYFCVAGYRAEGRNDFYLSNWLRLFSSIKMSRLQSFDHLIGHERFPASWSLFIWFSTALKYSSSCPIDAVDVSPTKSTIAELTAKRRRWPHWSLLCRDNNHKWKNRRRPIVGHLASYSWSWMIWKKICHYKLAGPMG